MRFDERIGGVLVAPRRTFARLGAGEARPSDVAWLVVMRLVAGELDRLARAVGVAREFGVGAAAQEILAVASVVMPDVVGILAAGVVMQLCSRSKRAFDVAAYAWVPYLTVQLAGALAFSARGVAPGATARAALEGLGLLWALAVWIVALVELRKLPADAGDAKVKS
ncbi:MAG TPA: hypothetical protein VGL86_19180 [Polyangia bacterium]|jgi:hypothetical protein